MTINLAENNGNHLSQKSIEKQTTDGAQAMALCALMQSGGTMTTIDLHNEIKAGLKSDPSCLPKGKYNEFEANRYAMGIVSPLHQFNLANFSSDDGVKTYQLTHHGYNTLVRSGLAG